MSLNFFDAQCQEDPVILEQFGICDDQDGTKAYTAMRNPHIWIATVINSQQKEIVFTAVDACVIKNGEHPGRGRCDGMLTWDDSLYFVELKDESKGWQQGAIEQLESTIQFFIDNHDIELYRHKKAFACNRRRRHFVEIDNEQNLRFFRRYKFRIDIQAEIIVI